MSRSAHRDTSRRGARLRRWARRAAKAGGVLFIAVGLVSTWHFLAGPPGVGHFRTVEGRQEYVAAYRVAFDSLPAPSAVHQVSTDWGTVQVYEWVSPETKDLAPVVLLPGRSSGVPMWSANLAALVTQRRVLAFDALGDVGLSVQSAPFRSFDDQARWIDQVLTQLAPRGAHLVGHSFGGAVAASYARLFPDQVISLTLLEPVFTFAYPPMDLLAWTVVASLPVMPAPLRHTALAKVGGSDYDPSDPMAAMIAAGSQSFAAALPQPALLTEAQYAQLRMPVYVAIAEHDSLAGGTKAATQAERLPNGTVVTWPDTTHSLPMQVAAALDTTMLAFFAQHDR